MQRVFLFKGTNYRAKRHSTHAAKPPAHRQIGAQPVHHRTTPEVETVTRAATGHSIVIQHQPQAGRTAS